MKLGLGTVQFGLDYGISNKDGKTSEEEAKSILALAAKQDMTVIDTGSQYGNSEEVVGESLRFDHSFRIVTKTPSFKKARITADDALRLKEVFYASLKSLKQNHVHGLLIHHADDLLSNGGVFLWHAMQELKDAGAVRKIGVSVYFPDQLVAVLDHFPIDLVQLPVNILDQRMIHNGYLKKLSNLKIEIHSRSAFLQGLLLMAPDTLPAYFSSIRKKLADYHRMIGLESLTPVQAALGFVCGIHEIDAVIVGVNNTNQLLELCDAVRHSPASHIDFSQFAIFDQAIVNPSLWNYSRT